MFSFFKRKPPHTPSEVAAGYIEAFANDTLKDPYSWDDFESAPESNREVELAIRLCWYVANRFPERNNREYMHPDGKPYFRKIAKLLRERRLKDYQDIDLEEARKGYLPDRLRVELNLPD